MGYCVDMRKSLCAVFAVFLLAMVPLSSVVAQTRTLGVSEGDQFTYRDITFEWECDHPNQTIPSSFKALNRTEYFTIYVETVSGTNVTCELTQHFLNGTEETERGYINVETGDYGNITFLPPPFTSKDLEINDTLYTLESYAEVKINETLTRTYADGERETNHVNMTAECSREDRYEALNADYYYDKSTGALVEVSEEYILQSGGYTLNYAYSIGIVQSYTWTSSFPLWVVITVLGIVAFFIAALIIFLSISRKLTKPDKET